MGFQEWAMDGSLTLRERQNVAAGVTNIYLQGLVDKGIEKFRERNYEVALQYLNQAITQDVEPPLAVLDKRAATHVRLGDLDAAVSDAGKMVRRDPKAASGYLRLGQVLQSQKRPEKALQVYDRGVEQVPPGAHYFKILQSEQHKLRASLAPRKLVDPLKNLPGELVQQMLSFLSFMDIVNISRVCRGWRHNVTTNQYLWTDLDFSRSKRLVPFSTIQTYVKRCSGTVKRYSTPGQFIPDGQPKMVCYVADRCKGLQELNINSIIAGETLAKAVTVMSGLRKLVISSHCEVSMDLCLDTLIWCRQLEHAEFPNVCRSGGLRLDKGVGDFPNLQTLILNFQHKSQPLLAQNFFKGIKNIRNLSLRRWRFICADPHDEDDSEPFTELTALQSLDLHECQMARLLKLPPSVRELRLDNANIQNSLFVLYLPNLERLSMAGNLGRAYLGEIFSTKPANLLHLNLGSKSFSRCAFINFMDEGYFNRLETLDLNFVIFEEGAGPYPFESIDDKFIVYAAQKLKSLRHLELCASHITGIGVRALVTGLRPTLKYLRLDHCVKCGVDAVDWARAEGVDVSFKFPETMMNGKKVRQMQ